MPSEFCRFFGLLSVLAIDGRIGVQKLRNFGRVSSVGRTRDDFIGITKTHSILHTAHNTLFVPVRRSFMLKPR